MSAFKTQILDRGEDVIVKFTIGVQTFSLYPIYRIGDTELEDAMKSAEWQEQMLTMALNNLLK